MRDKLKNMDSETMAFSTINMNSFSDAPSLQGTLEQPLEKKSGQQYSVIDPQLGKDLSTACQLLPLVGI